MASSRFLYFSLREPGASSLPPGSGLPAAPGAAALSRPRKTFPTDCERGLLSVKAPGGEIQVKTNPSPPRKAHHRVRKERN